MHCFFRFFSIHSRWPEELFRVDLLEPAVDLHALMDAYHILTDRTMCGDPHRLIDLSDGKRLCPIFEERAPGFELFLPHIAVCFFNGHLAPRQLRERHFPKAFNAIVAQHSRHYKLHVRRSLAAGFHPAGGSKTTLNEAGAMSVLFDPNLIGVILSFYDGFVFTTRKRKAEADLDEDGNFDGDLLQRGSPRRARTSPRIRSLLF